MNDVFDLVHFWAKIQIKNKDGSGFSMISTDTPPYDGLFEFTYNFVSQNQNSTSTITMHNLTPQHAKLIRVGAQCDIWAGWQNNDRSKNNISHILSDQIAIVQPVTNQSGDYQLQFTISDFQKVQNQKAIEIKISKNSRKNATLTSSITGYYEKKRHSLVKWHQSQDQQIEAWGKNQRNSIKGQKGDSSQRSQITNQQKAKKQQISNEYKRKSQQLKTSEQKAKLQAKRQKSKKKSKASKRNYKYLTYRKGSYASTIIKNLAWHGNLKIKKMNLVYNKKYIHGYSASQGPFQAIKSIVHDCRSKIFYVHGGLVIDSLINHNHINYTLSYDTGLLQDPSEDEEDDDLTSGTKLDKETRIESYEISAVFIPFITMSSVFRIKSPVINGLVQVTGGSLSYTSGSTPTTSITVQLLSDIKKATLAKNKMAKIATAKGEKIQKQKFREKVQKDDKRKRAYKARRAKRTAQKANSKSRQSKEK